MTFTLKTMRAAISAAALVMALGVTASAQAAALTGAMTLPNWATASTGAGDGFASVTGDNVTLTSSNNFNSGETDFSYLFSKAGKISFDWSYNTDDDGAEYDPASYFINRTQTYLANGGDKSYSGSNTVNLLSGDKFGWTIASEDGQYGSGFLNISNISFAPSAPAPLVGTGLLSALAALAALLALGMTRFARRGNVAA